MKNLNIIVIFILIFTSCLGSEDKNVIDVLDFALNEVVVKKYQKDFAISETFFSGLNDSLIKYDLSGVAENFNINFNLLNKQNENLKGKDLSNFIPKELHGNLKKNISNEFPVFFDFAPPLFNEDSTLCFIYFVIVFNESETEKWTHQYFVCERINEGWKLKGWLDLDRKTMN
jgi:hypothetical protein